MATRATPAANEIFSGYSSLFSCPIVEIENIGRTIDIPRFAPTLLISLCREFQEVNTKCQALESITSPTIVVGDIHGNLHSLLAIIMLHGLPPAQSYIFLGSFIDYGDYSIEVAAILFCLRILYPENVMILRGVNEHCPLNIMNGLCEQLEATYGKNTVWDAFCNAFGYLPFACRIFEQICVSHLRMLSVYPNLSMYDDKKLPIRLTTGSSFQTFTDVTDHFSQELVTRFCNDNKLNFVICSGDSDHGVYQVADNSRGCAVSCCESDSDIVLFRLEKSEVEPIIMHTPKSIDRATAKFVNLAPGDKPMKHRPFGPQKARMSF